LAELDDFNLERSPQPEGYGDSRRIGLWMLALAVVLAAAVAAYLYFWRSTAANPAAVAPPKPLESMIEPRTPAPATQMPLPELDQSDSLVRELVRQLSSHPELAAWLVPKDLIRTFTLVVEEIANGSNPAQRLRFLAPQQRFSAAGSGAALSIDPRSYRRFDTIADVVASLDAQGCAQTYRRLEPLIEQAYREQDHPEGGFEKTLERALRQILLTPVVEGQIALTPNVISYEFADPELKSLSPIQKQLVGMGPRNLRLIQAKLRAVAAALGISP